MSIVHLLKGVLIAFMILVSWPGQVRAYVWLAESGCREPIRYHSALFDETAGDIASSFSYYRLHSRIYFYRFKDIKLERPPPPGDRPERSWL